MKYIRTCEDLFIAMSLEASVTLLYIIDWSREVSLLAFFIAYALLLLVGGCYGILIRFYSVKHVLKHVLQSTSSENTLFCISGHNYVS